MVKEKFYTETFGQALKMYESGTAAMKYSYTLLLPPKMLPGPEQRYQYSFWTRMVYCGMVLRLNFPAIISQQSMASGPMPMWGHVPLPLQQDR